MGSTFKTGDTVYFLESKWRVREVKIVKLTAGFATIRFMDGAGGTRVHESKLYRTKEEAAAGARKSEPPLI